MSFIDLHCDTLLKALFDGAPSAYDLPAAMLDAKRLRQAGAAAQFFAIFFPPTEMLAQSGKVADDDEFYAAMLAVFANTLREANGGLAHIKTAADYRKSRADGVTGAFLTLEDGRIVNGSLDKLRAVYDDGVRLISLTWNGENSFGYPNSAEPTESARGLKPFGIEAVREFNELGIILDVSHLSDGGFWDVAEHTRKPFVASHSNARVLCNHQRNLTDEMIAAVAKSGGVVGVNFCPQFLLENSEKSTIDLLLAHLKHLINVGGEDVAALGSDFDGIGGELEIGRVEQVPLLIEKLADSVGARVADKAARGNAERVIFDVLR